MAHEELRARFKSIAQAATGTAASAREFGAALTELADMAPTANAGQREAIHIARDPLRDLRRALKELDQAADRLLSRMG